MFKKKNRPKSDKKPPQKKPDEVNLSFLSDDPYLVSLIKKLEQSRSFDKH